MIKNASNLYPFALQDQLSNGLTGQTPSVFLRQDNGSFAAASGSVTEVDSTNYPGLYQITLTAAECNCNVLTIAVSLPDGQEPAILDVVYPVANGGATPQQIWEYAGGRTVTNTIPTAQNIWEYSSRTLTASALTAQQVWEYSGGRTLTASPTDISGLATSTALSAVATNVSAVKAKTDNLPANPAAVGSEMALTSTVISAVQNGLATSSELSALETHGDSSWATATGFTTPSDLSGLSTFNASTDTVTINSTQAAGMATATGFATPSDIPSASDNASAVWSANSRTLTESALTAADVWSYTSRTLTASALTAQQVWEYGTRTLTASPTDLTGIATSQDIADLQTHGDSNWNTATGFATPTNVSEAKTDIIAAIPTDYAKPGNAMTLTSSTLASVVAGVWNYDNRELTQEIVSQVTAEDIASISIAVWSYVPRRLTSIVSDVIEPNK